MRDLVKILEGIGCENVKTYIQSGNAIFRTREDQIKKIAEKLGSKILEGHGFIPKVLLIRATELEDAIKNNPFKTMEGKTLHFFFLESTVAKPNLDELENVTLNSEKFKLDKNIFYLHVPDGIGRSKLAAKVEKPLGISVTVRNWNTVSKLLIMVKQAQQDKFSRRKNRSADLQRTKKYDENN